MSALPASASTAPISSVSTRASSSARTSSTPTRQPRSSAGRRRSYGLWNQIGISTTRRRNVRAARRLMQRPAPTPAIAAAHCSLASIRPACTRRAPRLRMRLGLACAQRAPRSCSAGGGGLLKTKMVQLFVSMVTRIKRHLPAAHISLDVSPWVSDVGEWMGTSLTRLTRDSRHLRPFLALHVCVCVCVCRRSSIS